MLSICSNEEIVSMEIYKNIYTYNTFFSLSIFCSNSKYIISNFCYLEWVSGLSYYRYSPATSGLNWVNGFREDFQLMFGQNRHNMDYMHNHLIKKISYITHHNVKDSTGLSEAALVWKRTIKGHGQTFKITHQKRTYLLQKSISFKLQISKTGINGVFKHIKKNYT